MGWGIRCHICTNYNKKCDKMRTCLSLVHFFTQRNVLLLFQIILSIIMHLWVHQPFVIQSDRADGKKLSTFRNAMESTNIDLKWKNHILCHDSWNREPWEKANILLTDSWTVWNFAVHGSTSSCHYDSLGCVSDPTVTNLHYPEKNSSLC